MSAYNYRISVSSDGFIKSVNFTESEIDHWIISRSKLLEIMLDKTIDELSEHLKTEQRRLIAGEWKL